ncbi:hypothetical protein F4809DRAFT_636533 [Biscogniauxia mediterranea]|nr:hypothetical protein F4809DRAFT_636533 [Biscogniauxia mediterranea]
MFTGELAALQSRTRNLREQLKQSIEILEESRGKAIRVFTVVTVFFLLFLNSRPLPNPTLSSSFPSRSTS